MLFIKMINNILFFSKWEHGELYKKWGGYKLVYLVCEESWFIFKNKKAAAKIVEMLF